MTLVVPRKQAHRSLARPELERVCLVFALVMRPLDLEDCVARRDDVGDKPAQVRLLEVERPLLGALRDELREPLLPAFV